MNFINRSHPFPVPHRIINPNDAILKKKLPLVSSNLFLGRQPFPLEEIHIDTALKTFRFKHTGTFTYQDKVYNLSEWVVKILNPTSAPSNRIFENPKKTMEHLKNNNIRHPEVLITPWNYDHQTHGRFWIVKKIPNEIDTNNPNVIAFIKELYELNVANPEWILEIKKEYIRLDENNIPYYTSFFASRLTLEESIESDLFELIQTPKRQRLENLDQ